MNDFEVNQDLCDYFSILKELSYLRIGVERDRSILDFINYVKDDSEFALRFKEELEENLKSSKELFYGLKNKVEELKEKGIIIMPFDHYVHIEKALEGF